MRQLRRPCPPSPLHPHRARLERDPGAVLPRDPDLQHQRPVRRQAPVAPGATLGPTRFLTVRRTRSRTGPMSLSPVTTRSGTPIASHALTTAGSRGILVKCALNGTLASMRPATHGTRVSTGTPVKVGMETWNGAREAVIQAALNSRHVLDHRRENGRTETPVVASLRSSPTNVPPQLNSNPRLARSYR